MSPSQENEGNCEQETWIVSSINAKLQHRIEHDPNSLL